MSQLPLILMSMGAAPRLKFVGSETAWIKSVANKKAAASAPAAAPVAIRDQSPDPERSFMDWARVPEVEWQHIDELLDVSPQAEAVQSGSRSVAATTATTTTTAVVEP